MIPDSVLDIKNRNGTHKSAFRPVSFKLKSESEYLTLGKQLEANPYIEVTDTFASQVRELVKLRNPGTFSTQLFERESALFFSGSPAWQPGTWFYYPWSCRLVHVLDEEEFIEVRTNRNKLKITAGEQEQLRKKTVGVIGLSVGQSVALTLCMERCCGTIRLADFDELELSNLNRLRTGLHNLGQKKAVIAAREIAEIDPYIRVELYEQGVTAENIDEFFSGLDLLVEVCDSVDVKVSSRMKARELGIPVVMDTNDRGMIDIERFDLEPGRPLLHGLVGEHELERLGSCTPEERMSFILRIISYEHTSERLKQSMEQINKTITSWPQLASSVVLGGAATTDVVRRILLDELSVSGRFYVDFDRIIS